MTVNSVAKMKDWILKVTVNNVAIMKDWILTGDSK